jgi:hypothetical protein
LDDDDDHDDAEGGAASGDAWPPLRDLLFALGGGGSG